MCLHAPPEHAIFPDPRQRPAHRRVDGPAGNPLQLPASTVTEPIDTGSLRKALYTY